MIGYQRSSSSQRLRTPGCTALHARKLSSTSSSSILAVIHTLLFNILLFGYYHQDPLTRKFLVLVMDTINQVLINRGVWVLISITETQMPTSVDYLVNDCSIFHIGTLSKHPASGVDYSRHLSDSPPNYFLFTGSGFSVATSGYSRQFLFLVLFSNLVRRKSEVIVSWLFSAIF
ncbi:hypothetical protein A0H81_06181 [Grifola frondosa]|uniref:Uncharacterized protein n=1 Tax=Grifola frondosa TaxID=5627 RepID=A0A1C7MBA8_GRIFR|nr:hypothetical protein A0H81_06181 [Grifola frondosa]